MLPAVADEAAQAELRRQVVARLQEALSKFGAAGRVHIDEGRAVLESAGVTVSTEVAGLLGRWDELAPAERQRACTDVPRRSPWVWVAVGAVCAMFLAGLVLGRPWQSGTGDDSASPPVRRRADDPGSPGSSAGQLDRETRAAQVCQATVARISRGATVGPTDTEGWVVELGLLSNRAGGPMTDHPGLARFIAREPGAAVGRFVWPDAPELSRIEGPSTRVEIGRAGVHGRSARGWYGVRLTFTGRYVLAYFDESQRLAYLRTALALSTQTGATHAGLYARCARGSTHHLGAWFLGQSPTDVATSLVYFMGVFASPPHVSSAVLGADAGAPGGHGATLQALAGRTGSLDRERIATVLGAHDGMITGPRGGPAIITFPFRDGNRATRASHQLATFLGLVPAR